MSDDEIKKTMSCTRGLSGLNNLGNTCYMNSVLQAISSTDLLNYYLRKHMFKAKLKHGIKRKLLEKLRRNTDLKSDEEVEISKKKLKYKFKHSITYRLYQVIKIMWNINCELKPEKFKRAVDTLLPQFKGYSQHDSHEFLIYLLDFIHEEIKSDVQIKKIKLNKLTLNYIDTKTNLKNLIELATDENEKETYKNELKKLLNENYILDVQYEGLKFYENFIRNNHSIVTDLFYGLFLSEIECENCLNKSVTFEPFNVLQLDMEQNIDNLEDLLNNYFNKSSVDYKCDECKNDVTAKKSLRIHMLPEKIIIQLKRFIVRGRYSRKNNYKINFPLDNLVLNEIINDKDIHYELYSVVNHMGDVGGGHYTNYSRNQINKEWYEFNDSSVSYLTVPEDEIISSNAYILFYQKKR
jgi:ubiquitin carboxyl-terminal hydrolase 8